MFAVQQKSSSAAGGGARFFIVLLVVATLATLPPIVQSVHLLEDRIINGQASVHYPHHVSVAYQNGQGQGYFGGGSIISPHHVLTIAQNVHGFVTWTIGYGSNQVALLSYVVTQNGLAHPNYNVDSRENDIALVIVGTAFVWSANVQPINLPPANQVLPLQNEQGTILGFGWTSSTENVQASQLRVAFVRVIPDATCQPLMAISFPNHFCAFDNVTPANICQGDLGGGLLVHYRNQLTLVGLNSILLEGCATTWPSAYTRVSPYRAWISQNAGV